MKRVLFLLAFLSLFLASCEKKDDIPQNVIEEARMDGRAYDALKRAGVVVADYHNVFGAGVGEAEIDSKGNGIHYYQVAATKGGTAYIFLMNYTVAGQGLCLCHTDSIADGVDVTLQVSLRSAIAA